MIVFDLRCSGGHVFEAWFGTSYDFDDQAARGLVSCPVCGDAAIEKAMMAPRVGAKGNAGSSPLRPSAPEAPHAAKAKAMLAALAAAQSKALESSTWVGPRFADEARAIHLGDSQNKQIHGQATPEEAKRLIEDGVPVAPLPFPVRRPGSDN